MELDIKKHYPKDWVVLQNRVVECFKSMTLDEKRLFIMATPLARTTNVSSGEPIFISTDEFASACGLEITGAYTALGVATKKLFDRSFGYVRADKKKVSIRWMYKTAYGDGGSELYFTDEVLLLLREFDALNPYTKYKKEVVLRLKKDYSLDLYHLAKKHQNMGGFQISLDDLFEQLGLPKSYKRIGNLKDRVINPSLDEITKNTDIDLTYENVKKGRSVVGFKFTVREKPKPKSQLIASEKDVKTVDLFCNMSDAQINKYSTILSKLPELSDLSNFPDYPTFAIWISGILRDPKCVREETAKRIFKVLHQKTDFKP
ncbi:RepB family plasmid replication initiator protein (plasmid) [Acinetobacter haemolyticus]|uniref:replication initiation protein n=1 Tax=Acinetobacter haemolyticus TaxID=29430 RepID=UPI001331CE2C|nr:replication initiation protein [Acinetobacter haemolyticus]NAR84245.1 RepB family plasmid replication initiator protein [Acinetobacter haemolyticus]NAS03827.1 RepB family plasmid replication initiator protein [Acinetobacter haemolyticus]QHI27994.1 replication initiation protein [Acinetobacter haemolyticus]QHI34349.1 RepB family plasmid replication initiator protein [Acinetobacter haemolyticus]